MARKTVNHNAKAYIIGDGVVENLAYKKPIDANVDLAYIEKERTYYANGDYHIQFDIVEQIDSVSYTGKSQGNIGIGGKIDPTWITDSNISRDKVKIDAINKLFSQKEATKATPSPEPLDSSGNVKAEFV